MRVHLVDGTYELFRFHYAKSNRDPRRGAQRGVLNSMLDLLADGATHVGIATDHVIESFRNEMLDGYKDGSGVDPDLKAQFGSGGVAGTGRLRGVAPDRARGRRRAGVGRGGGRRRPPGGAGGDLHAGQGPGPVRDCRQPGGAV